MKKLTLTITIILGLLTTTHAQPSGGGLFQRGDRAETNASRNGNAPMLPSQHGADSDQNADGPIGSGLAVLLGLGGAYLIGKKRKGE